MPVVERSINDRGARMRAAEALLMLSGLAARDWLGEYLVKGRLDDVAERLSRDYDPALIKETG